MTFPPRYHPEGQDSWDFWHAKWGNTFYVFYLQCPIDAPVRFGPSTVGLATSQDQIHWTEYGEVLRANPPGQWNDAWIATGSVWRQIDHWRMLFTGQTYTGQRGPGLATSNDLLHWTRVGSGPVQLNYQPFVVPVSPYWQSRGFAAGRALRHTLLADPFVLPEPIDGMLYMVVSTLFDDEPMGTRGCVTLWRSPDGRVWDEVGALAADHLYDQMEAPQLWRRGDRWYLLFGAGRAEPFIRATMVYTAPTMYGPFEPSPASQLLLPDDPGWFYLGKVERNAYGQDIFLGQVGGTLSHPYSILYEADGSLTLGAYDASFSQWVPGGVTGLPGPVVPDLAGGVISNGRSRVNGNGFAVWGPTSAMSATRWASDGLGGSVGVAIQSNDVYGTRCTRKGTLPWGTRARVSGASGTQSSPVVAPDGSGGAFFAWIDPASSGDVYAQHLDSVGRALWPANGVAVCAVAGAQSAPLIVGDGTGGAIVTWRDARSGAVGGADIYAQRVSAAGTPVWAANGIAVCAAAGIQESPVLETDGAGGAYVAWSDSRGGDRDVYAQRLGPAGSPYWAPNGVLVGGGANDQWRPALAQDGVGGLFVAWQDHRSGGAAGIDIHAQHLDPAGAARWPANGAPVCAEPAEQNFPSIVADRTGGIVVAWMDARDNTSTTSTYYRPYAQRLDANAAPVWTPGGVRVEVVGAGTTAPAAPSIASDFSGGIYLSGTSGLHRVLGDGRLGWIPNFTPRITGVTDAPGDQGGFVRIDVTGPYSEMAPFAPAITAYEVWRSVTPPALMSRWPRSGGAARPEGATRSEGVASSPPIGWELVSSFSPSGSMGYTVLAPTRADSSAAGWAAEEFVVAARTATPGYFLPSDSWIGYSADNLAPAPPQGLALHPVGESTVRVTWAPNAEPDLALYRVYKGTPDTFTPAPQNLLGEPTAPQWEDSSFSASSHYKISAVDRNGNESSAIPASPSNVSNVPPTRVPALVPSRSYLGRIAPNPMSIAGTVEYGLARGGPVSLAIHDLTGRRVRGLVQGTIPPGVWQVRWDARDDHGSRVRPGVYLLRFTGGGVERSGKIVVLE